MRELIVGDLHAVMDELDDVAALFEGIYDVVQHKSIDRVVFLGDMHHNFAITNVGVTGFYKDKLSGLQRLLPPREDHEKPNIIMLVGNHDMPGNGHQTPHALLSYVWDGWVIDGPTYVDDEKTLFLPYYASAEEFHKAVDLFPDAEFIYCHQEFNGAKYDNGFFAPHGADASKMEVPTISGHIHTPQTLGKVTYIGAPRWRTLSDANIDRHMWILDRSKPEKEMVDTSKWCRRIWSATLTEENSKFGLGLLRGDLCKDLYRIQIEGSAAFVKEHEAEIRKVYKRVRISAIISTGKVAHVRESDGIDVAFKKFVGSFAGKKGTTPDKLITLALERVYGTSCFQKR
jgi:hypothetical protein